MAPGLRAQAPASAVRPNIILIVTDDQTVGDVAYMPRVRQALVAGGASFSNYFTTFSLCCPARASILRGQYTHNTLVQSNSDAAGGFDAFHDLAREESTVATWLHDAGYRTALVGKYLNHYPASDDSSWVPPGWTEWHASYAMGDKYYGLKQTITGGEVVSYGTTPTDYRTDVEAGEAMDFVRRAAADSAPFFLYLAPFAPHDPATPAPRHLGAFPGLQFPRTPAVNEANVRDKPRDIRARALLSARTLGLMDSLYRKRLCTLLAVDEMIGALVDTLAARGALDHTYILFTSDNGFHFGQHRLLAGKATGYEEDIHLPLLVRGPGVSPGSSVEVLALNIDLAPTIATLAGVPTPKFVDGRSLTPWLWGHPPERWRAAFLVEKHVRSFSPATLAIRTIDHFFALWPGGERELYDLRKDPYELNNLLGHGARRSVSRSHRADSLTAWIGRLEACAGASCRAEEEVE